MNILIAGGGTGGHLIPGIRVAEGLKERIIDVKIIFCVGDKGIDKQVLDKEGYEFRMITMHSLYRGFKLRNLKLPYYISKGFFQSWRIISEFQPDVVVGTGGYISGPVVFTATLRGVPTVILEQNTVPGLTTKILSILTDEVLVGFPDTGNYLYGNVKVEVTGNPIRKPVKKDTEELRRNWGLNNSLPVLLITGGSQGAHFINELIVNMLSLYKGTIPYQVIFQTGKNDYPWVFERCGQLQGNIIVKDYIREIDDVYSISNLVVCRGGAMTLSEVTAWALPSIIIPYPYATDNHQEMNARVIENKGAGVVVLQKDATPEMMRDKIEFLFKDYEKKSEMQTKAKLISRPDAVDRITERIINISRKREKICLER